MRACGNRSRRLALGALLAGCSALLPGLAGVTLAQGVPSVSRPVIQPLPGPSGRTLNEALSRVGRNPRDVEALLDAGNAALAMGDVDAALGFYRRADTVVPGDPRVKAGLAGAMVRNGDPFSAIPLYNAAESAGALFPAALADRGLAYDLVGDNLAAQKYYRQALENGQDDEVVHRLALSHAIAGDARASEAALAPLLERQDKGAWRTRAFALAILGRPEDAVRTANSILPPDLAASIAPYLRYMPRLTPAQQAAAANFGDFPRASAIGIDDPRVAQFAPARRPNAVLAAASGAEARAGENPSRRSRRNRARVADAAPSDGVSAGSPRPVIARSGMSQPSRDRAAAPAAAMLPAPSGALPADRATVPDPLPARQVSGPPAPAIAQESRPVVQPLPARAAVAGIPASGVVAAATVAVPASPAAVPVASPSTMGSGRGDPASAAPSVVPVQQVAAVAAPMGTQPSAPVLAGNPPASSMPAAPPVPASTPAASGPADAAAAEGAAPPPRPARPRSIFEAFADLARPTVDVTPASGAVDIRRIRPARETTEAADEAKPGAAKPASRKPAPPSHPSRIWVQIATGRDKDALAFDWRRLVREEPEAFRGRQPSISAWGQRNRLLAGPFPTEAAANAYIVQLRRAGVNGAFVWTSPAGQVVDALAVR